MVLISLEERMQECAGVCKKLCMLTRSCVPDLALPGAPYLPLLPKFRQLFPGVDPNPLVASVLFWAPIIRDFISWCGVRQVRCSAAPCPDLALCPSAYSFHYPPHSSQGRVT